MQTEISQLLTAMPTGTVQTQGEITQTPNLPTVAVQTETPTQEQTAETVILSTQPPAATETAAPQPLTPEAGMVATATLIQTTTPGPAATNTATPAIKGTSGPTAVSTATAAPSANDPRTWLGSPASTDLMDSPNAWVWPTGQDRYTRSMFRNGRQSVQALTTKDGWRMANPAGREFTDLYLEATFNVGETCQKDAPGMADHYGIIVRVPVLQEPYQGYLYAFNCNGEYSLRSWNWDGMDERRQEMRMLVDWSMPKTADKKIIINAGTRATNKMGIMTIGSKIRLYANGNFLAEYDYNTNNNIPHISSGYFGVFVGSREDTNFTMWVDEMSYWENPKP
jgi:hypothetical protein